MLPMRMAKDTPSVSDPYSRMSTVSRPQSTAKTTLPALLMGEVV